MKDRKTAKAREAEMRSTPAGRSPRHGGKLVPMLTGVVLSGALLLAPAGAITPQYKNMTTAYRNSRYYLNLEALRLTGDARTDLVMVAMSQLGYHEGNSKSQCNGENTRGNGNYVEYNYCNGSVDQYGNGTLTYGYPWCAAFVSWCARMAEIPIYTLPNSVSCASWVQYFRSQGQYRARASGYIPQQGDLIFFRNRSSDAISTHVGIVRYVCNGIVYTIEGNSENQVRLVSYSLNDTYIVGYGVPSYSANPATAIDYLLDEYQEGNYIIAAATLPVRASASYTGRVTYTLRRGDLMHIYECRGTWGRTDYGWIPMGDTQPIDLYRR